MNEHGTADQYQLMWEFMNQLRWNEAPLPNRWEWSQFVYQICPEWAISLRPDMLLDLHHTSLWITDVVFALLGCYEVLIGSNLPMSWDNLSVLPSRVKHLLELIRWPKTSITTYQHCITSQKSKDRTRSGSLKSCHNRCSIQMKTQQFWCIFSWQRKHACMLLSFIKTLPLQYLQSSTNFVQFLLSLFLICMSSYV